MHVFVTGGYGFIGSHVLLQLVDEGHTVTCFDLGDPSPVSAPVHDQVTHVRGDVADPISVYNALVNTSPDRIIHLAALLSRPSQADPRRAFEVNVGGTLNVLEAAAALGINRVVGASSVSSYGHVDPSLDALDESVVQQPWNIYGLTKYVLEHLGRTYQDQTGVEFAAIEPTHGIGPDRQRGNVEDACLVKAAVSNTPLKVPRIEDPVDFIYVGDEASAFVLATLADTLPHDRYLIGTGDRYTLTEIAGLIQDRVPGAAFEFGPEERYEQLLARPPADTTRIREDLGWEPTLTIPEAIDAYVEWLEANPEAWSFDPADAPWPQ